MSEIKVKDFEVILTKREKLYLIETTKTLEKIYKKLNRLDNHNYNAKTNMYKTELMTAIYSLKSVCKRIDFCDDKKGELKRTS